MIEEERQLRALLDCLKRAQTSAGYYKAARRHTVPQDLWAALIHSEGADSFRQWAQGWSESAVSAGARPRRRNTGGWAA